MISLKETYFLKEYYTIKNPNNPPSIKQVINTWQEKDYGKARDAQVQAYYSVDELWPYREYTWTREKARGGPENWDRIKKSLEAKGWDDNDPLILNIGRNGVAKVGEGNHRLAISKEIGLNKIPVQFFYKDSVHVDPELKRDPVIAQKRWEKKQKEAEKKKREQEKEDELRRKKAEEREARMSLEEKAERDKSVEKKHNGLAFWKIENIKMSKKLKKIIREMIEEELQKSYFSAKDAIKIYQELEKALGVPLPKKRFTKRDEGRRKAIEAGDLEIDFSFGQGILVIQSWKKIPNINKVASMLRKYFGDVHVRPPGYINARDFGQEYEEYAKIELPKKPKKIISIPRKGIKTKKDALELVSKIRNVLKSREAKTQQKNLSLSAKVIGGRGSTKLVKIDDDLFVHDGFNFYYVMSTDEANKLMKLINTKDNIMRNLEVQSWDMGRLGPEGQFD